MEQTTIFQGIFSCLKILKSSKEIKYMHIEIK